MQQSGTEGVQDKTQLDGKNGSTGNCTKDVDYNTKWCIYKPESVPKKIGLKFSGILW